MFTTLSALLPKLSAKANGLTTPEETHHLSTEATEDIIVTHKVIFQKIAVIILFLCILGIGILCRIFIPISHFNPSMMYQNVTAFVNFTDGEYTTLHTQNIHSSTAVL